MPAMSARTCMSIAALLALLLSATVPAARAQATDADAACRTATELLKLQWPLTETRARLLRDGAELRVLAVGSSSTQGHGASAPEMTYPAQLRAELTRRHPALRVSMHNIGAGGTDVHHAIARMEQELLAEVNALGIGPMGLGGDVTCLGVRINMAPCHIASLPLAVNIQCHSARHEEVEL